MAEVKRLTHFGRKRKVLVADESITIQKLVHLGLASGQFEVITCADGQDAFLKVKSMKPDLVLADCNLRQLDGFDLVEKIRGDSSLTATKTVLMKGQIPKGKEDRLKNVVTDEILSKPFDAKTLLDLVHKLLLDEESTLVKKPIDKPMDEEITPIVKLQGDKVEQLNRRLQQAASEVVPAPDELPQKIKDLSSLDEDTAKVKPQDFKSPVHVEAPEVRALTSSQMETAFREEIQKWAQSNLTAIAEKILKDEIGKLIK